MVSKVSKEPIPRLAMSRGAGGDMEGAREAAALQDVPRAAASERIVLGA